MEHDSKSLDIVLIRFRARRDNRGGLTSTCAAFFNPLPNASVPRLLLHLPS